MPAGDPASLTAARVSALDRRRGERLATRAVAVATLALVLAAVALAYGAQG